jgi:hypothetical protein
MHLRVPAFSRAFTSTLWGVGLGLYIWIGSLAVDVSGGTAFLLGLVSGIGIFFFVLRLGGDEYRA